jgi:Putative transposase of IS4/5 family (DUF4096)
MRYELTDYEWAAIKPFLPNKPCGVPRANERRVLNGIFWVLRPAARPFTRSSSASPFDAPHCPPFGGSYEKRDYATSMREKTSGGRMDRCDQHRRAPALRGIDHEDHSDCRLAPAAAFTVSFDSASV